MSQEIHAHKVLNLLKATPMSESELQTVVEKQFGADVRFRTCKLDGFDFDSLMAFFKRNQKIVQVDDKWTMNEARVCSH
ncbi:YecH family protein [Vibrio sp. AK197]